MGVLFKYLWSLCLALALISACRSVDNNSTDLQESVVTPVEVTSVRDSSLSENIELTAVSVYLEKSTIKANINGYVQRVDAKLGKRVSAHQNLFRLITKEAKSIGNIVNALDPEFKFSGLSIVKAEKAGIIISVNHQKGDYVQDGELLATLINKNSLVFLLDLPYELNSIINQNKAVNILLPDGNSLKGSVAGTMPSVDSLAQTQRFIIKVNSDKDIPEGLIAKVSITKALHQNTQLLPKSAVLANETETEFWVMKMINDSIAVKVKVNKGLENTDFIEVLSPKFSKSDRIIKSGNYGIADTAKVKIEKKQ